MSNYVKEDLNRRSALFKQLGVDEVNLSRDIQIIKNWVKQEKHLPQDITEDELIIERFLINNKFRIEQTKTKLENYYTMKGIHKVLFQDMWKITPSESVIFRFPLRKLTPDRKRISLTCRIPGLREPRDFLDMVRMYILTTEMTLRYDYCDTQIAILDLRAFSSDLLMNFDINLLYKLAKIVKACYSGRVEMIHAIHCSTREKIIIYMIQTVFKNKIKVHNDLESLYEDIPREYLPKDYGGEDISVKEYGEIWDTIVKEEEDFLRKLPLQVVNESLRVGKSTLDADIFGVDGTFKQLNLD